MLFPEVYFIILLMKEYLNIKMSEASENCFGEVYQDMILQFCQNELKPKEHFENVLQNPNYKLFIFEADNEKIGYLFCYVNDYLWADYFAIYRNYQSRGYGSKILSKVFEEYKNLKGCFFEVEQVRQEDLKTKKRQDFYKKIGCKKLDFEYYFPNDFIDLPMDLFYFCLAEKNIPSKSEIFSFLKKIFYFLHKDVQKKDKILKMIEKGSKI